MKNIESKNYNGKDILEIAKNKGFPESEVRNLLQLKRQIDLSIIKSNLSFAENFQKSLVEFTNRKGREECEKCLAWHIVVGSTPKEEIVQFLDFEDEDNIENLLKSFLNSLQT